VVLHATEVIAPGDVREVGDRQHARGGDEEARSHSASVVGGHLPGAGRVVPHRGAHSGTEPHVAPEVEPIDHVVEVLLDLGLGGEVLLPRPVVEQLAREEVAVGVALRIEPSTWVPVPEPRAADALASLDELRREPLLERTVQLVDAGDAGTDDQHLDVGGCGRERHCTERLA
jgi:hypothetical protein